MSESYEDYQEVYRFEEPIVEGAGSEMSDEVKALNAEYKKSYQAGFAASSAGNIAESKRLLNRALNLLNEMIRLDKDPNRLKDDYYMKSQIEKFIETKISGAEKQIFDSKVKNELENNLKMIEAYKTSEVLNDNERIKFDVPKFPENFKIIDQAQPTRAKTDETQIQDLSDWGVNIISEDQKEFQARHEEFSNIFNEALAVNNANNKNRAKKLFKEALAKLNDVMEVLNRDKEANKDLINEYAKLASNIENFIKDNLSTQTSKEETVVRVTPEIVDTAKSVVDVKTTQGTAVEQVQERSNKKDNTKKDAIVETQIIDDKDIPRVDKLFNIYVATFDMAMDAFNRGDAKNARRLFDEACGMLKTLILREKPDSKLKLKYEDLYKEIQELIAMHLSGPEKPVQASNDSMPYKQYATVIEDDNAIKNGDVDIARAHITEANEIVRDIVKKSNNKTIKQQYNISYERTEKLSDDKLAKTKFEVQNTIEDIEK